MKIQDAKASFDANYRNDLQILELLYNAEDLKNKESGLFPEKLLREAKEYTRVLNLLKRGLVLQKDGKFRITNSGKDYLIKIKEVQ